MDHHHHHHHQNQIKIVIAVFIWLLLYLIYWIGNIEIYDSTGNVYITLDNIYRYIQLFPIALLIYASGSIFENKVRILIFNNIAITIASINSIQIINFLFDDLIKTKWQIMLLILICLSHIIVFIYNSRKIIKRWIRSLYVWLKTYQ